VEEVGELLLLFSDGLGWGDVWVIGGDSIGVVSTSWMTTERVGGSSWFEEEGEGER